MSELQIGRLTDAEIGPAVELWRLCGLTRPWNDPHADARLALASPSSTVLGGRIESALIASAMVGFDGHRAWVYYLAVSPKVRGGGHGATMMRACEAWAVERGAPKLQLMVRTDNEGAKGFYDVLGYARQEVLVLGRRLDGAAHTAP